MRAVHFIVVAIGTCLAQAQAAETSDQWERSLAKMRALPEQFHLERAISLEEIAAGVARGDWTEQEAAEAKSWLQRVFTPARVWDSMGESRMRSVSLAALAPLDTSGSSRPITYLRSTLDARCRALLQQESNYSTSVLLTAARAANEIWTKARKPEDLRPAVRIIEETFAEFKEAILVPPARFSPPRPPDGQLIYTAMGQFKDAYSLIHPDQPFLFPDPAADPAGFREMWRYYLALRTTERFLFFTQAIVNHRIGILRWQYEANAESAWVALKKVVLENAPTERLAAALERVAQLQPLPVTSTSYSPRPIFGPPSREPPAPPDYRTVAKRWVDENAERPHESHIRQQHPYREWLAFRRAEEARDSEAMARQAESLRLSLGNFPPELATHIAERLAVLSSPAPEREAASAVQELSQRLASTLVVLRDGSASSLQALAKQWSSLANPEAESPGSTNDSIGAWLLLAARDDRQSWFALRDKALRELFSAMEKAPGARPDATVPFPAQMRDLLEGALERGDTDRAARLLAIDAASALLGIAERTAYLQTVNQVASARSHLEAGRIAEARLAFRGALAGGQSPASAQFATQELKRLSKPGSR